MQSHPLSLICHNTSKFIISTLDEELPQHMVYESLLQSIDGLFHTIISSAWNDEEKHNEIKNIGYTMSENGSFVPGMKKAILFRINIKESRESFLDFLYNEFKLRVTPELVKKDCWKIVMQDNKLVLYTLKEFERPKVSLYKRAQVKVFRLKP